MKHILAENMRRFGTKNLSEAPDPKLPQSPERQAANAMAQWVDTYIKDHGFKYTGDSQGTRIYVSPQSLKGRVEIRVWNNLQDRTNDRIDINVLRQGVQVPGVGNTANKEAYLFSKEITPQTWDPMQIKSTEAILAQYVK